METGRLRRATGTVSGRGSAAFCLAVAAASPAFAQYSLTTLASFNGANGANPYAGLVLSGDTLFGTTYSGGAAGDGEVFSLPTIGGTPDVLASFNGANGSQPYAGLVLDSSGTLYGATSNGSAQPYEIGTIFSLSPGGGSLNVLSTLFSEGFLAGPRSTLILANGALYGVLTHGGINTMGTIFDAPTTGGSTLTVGGFNSAIGNGPVGSLSLSNGVLYGAVQYVSGSGGTNGAIYELPLSGGTISTISGFNGVDGSLPAAGLLIAANTIYGTTEYGGVNNDGVVFSLPLTGGMPTTLCSFNGSDGQNPEASLILSGNTLFGTTVYGGADGFGEVFSVPISGGSPAILASFDSNDGAYPYANLVMDASGDLYGTTEEGGIANEGTVFELTPVVPEPTSISLLALGSLMLLRRARTNSSHVRIQ